MTQQQTDLFSWVRDCHGQQLRKYTFEPYWHHLQNVYDTALEFGQNYPLLFECCVCHDLIEDTKTSLSELYKQLIDFGYTASEATIISNTVAGLTEKYTSNGYPELNRAIRKQLEAQRLATTDFLTQTVKYADLIDNLSSIVENDPGFARTYLIEKKEILRLCNKGDFDLYLKACSVLVEAEEKLRDEVG